MSLAVLADHLASKGRNGDTMLVHMTPEEVHGLHALALAHGGQLTINPETGLPEANFLKKMLPMIAGMALNFIAPGVGTYIGGLIGASGAVGTGIAIGGLTGLATGSLKQGIMAGLGAYGGASLAGGLETAGMAAAQKAAMTPEALAQITGPELVGNATAEAVARNQLAEQATRDFMSKGAFDRFGAGISALGSEAGRTAALQGVGGASGLMRAGFMGMAGADAFGQPQTATQMPGSGFKYPPRIRPMSWNQYTGQLEQLPMFSAINQAGLTPTLASAPGMTTTKTEEQPPGGYNTGGIVALAVGGSPEDFRKRIYADGADDTLATQRGVEYAREAGLNPQETLNLWNSALGTNFGMSDYDRVMQQFPTAPAPAPVVAAQTPVVTAPAPAPFVTATPAPAPFVEPLAQEPAPTPTPSAFDFLSAPPAPAAMAPIPAPAPAPELRTGSQAEQNVLNTIGWQSRSGQTGIAGLNSNINMWLADYPKATEGEIRDAMKYYGLNDADIVRATGKTVSELGYKAPAPTPAPVPAPAPAPVSTASVTFGGDTVIPEYTPPVVAPTTALKPTAPTMSEVTSTYEQGGGSTKMPTITDIKPTDRTYTQNAVADMLTGYLQANPYAAYGDVVQFARSRGIPEMQARAAYNEFRFSTMTGGTKQAYDYLMGRAPYSTKPFVPGGGPIMKPYAEAVGLAAPGSTGGGGYFGRQTIPTSPTQQNAQGTTGTTAGIAGLTTKPTADTLRSTFDQSIFGKTPLEKAAYYNSLLAKGYDDATIRAAINAPLDENWLALRELAASLKTGAPTAGGGSTSGGGTTFLGGSNTRMDGTKKSDSTSIDTTKSTDASTVGGVVVGNNVIDPISGGVLGVVTANVDQGTGGIIQGDLVIDPITGKIIGYSQDAGLTGQLFNKPIGDVPAPIESRYVPSDTAYYDFGAGNVPFDNASNYGGRYSKNEMDMMAGMRQGGLADVAAMSAARGGNVQGYNLGGYSDGERLLRGPGDGVSDSIPATIGNKQPARLADGEFVIPARIVSEIGNGSTEAGARKLYAMMDRVQRARAKTTGKGKVAKNTRAEKYLPA